VNLIASGFITAVGGFSCVYGSFSATASSATLLNVTGKRGFVFLDGQGLIGSSILAYFSAMTPYPYLSIVARNGNAFTSQNIGTANGTGTMLINATLNTSSDIRVSANQNGTITWAVVYF
jgi:hypothetical protein